jgi:hypothetical protein
LRDCVAKTLNSSWRISSSLIAITTRLGRHRLIMQLCGCATWCSFLCTAAKRRWINQRIFMCIQDTYNHFLLRKPYRGQYLNLRSAWNLIKIFALASWSHIVASTWWAT